MEELRSLIGFGKASYSISLPKAWIKTNKLKKGDRLAISESNSGSLEIYPKKGEDAHTQEIVIKIDGKEIDDIQRNIISAYINGYTIINIDGDLKGKIADIRGIFHRLMALEIMEVTSNAIRAKVFSDTTNTPIIKVLKRIDLITRSVFDDSLNTLEKSDNYKEIYEKDHEVNRQTFFAIRLITKALTDVEFAKKQELDILSLVYFWQIIDNIEKIADRAKAIAKVIVEKDVKKRIEEKQKKELQEVFDAVKKNYELLLDIFFKTKKEPINLIFKNDKKNRKRCEHLLEESNTVWLPSAVEKIKRISVLTENIARIVLNLQNKERNIF